MVVNFKTREIGESACKLTRTPILIKKIQFIRKKNPLNNYILKTKQNLNFSSKYWKNKNKTLQENQQLSYDLQ